ncbi:hypothetical protein [Jannaschia seohaensis]|nr:hypothetical protein [Jannaschia seohaensis]
MLTDLLLPVLAFGTLLTGVLFALVAQHKTIERMKDPRAPKSTLAADKDSFGTPADV